ncbi:MAG: hypothetical protein JEZ04_00775 [Spirochaetales bacterium]|nr:hypothetical protein [Spirochaetales bacterium]
MSTWEEAGWQEADLDKLELGFLKDCIKCNNPIGVAVTRAYASYLHHVGVHPDNYPIFLKILGVSNHWVIDSLIGDGEETTFFQLVQPNYFILKESFRIITQNKRGSVYPKSLLIIIGLLNQTYFNPEEGYKIFPLDTTNVNNLGKHLDEKQDQSYALNQSILLILDKVASMLDPGRLEGANEKVMAVAAQANNIRGKFLDMTKSLNEAIPDLLLEVDDYTKYEVKPIDVK